MADWIIGEQQHITIVSFPRPLACSGRREGGIGVLFGIRETEISRSLFLTLSHAARKAMKKTQRTSWRQCNTSGSRKRFQKLIKKRAYQSTHRRDKD
jgi:hypothetical protein